MKKRKTKKKPKHTLDSFCIQGMIVAAVAMCIIAVTDNSNSDFGKPVKLYHKRHAEVTQPKPIQVADNKTCWQDDWVCILQQEMNLKNKGK